MKTTIFSVILILLFLMLNAVVFSQPRFEPDSRLTDIIVKVEPTVLQLPEQQPKSILAQVDINVPELAEFISDRDVRLILRSFPDADPADTVMINQFGRTIKLLDRTRVFRFRFAEGTELEEMARQLQEVPGIIFAETIPEYKLFGVEPNDEHFTPRQWNLHHTGQGFQPAVTAGRADVRGPEAWSIYTGSQNVNIGIMDDGVLLTHEDLSGKTTGDTEKLLSSHGTWVAGVAAAITNNEDGIAGVDWSAQIIARDLGDYTPEEIYDNVISALNEDAHILNNSWGLSSSSTLMNRAFATAYNMNVLSVAAIGNDGNDDTTYYPAGLKNVMAIGATNHENERADFSNFGTHIDLVAPGEDIFTTSGPDNDDYINVSGTSFAAPHVSGAASLLRGYGQDELNKTLYNDDIRRIIQLSADEVEGYNFDANGWNEQMGHGRLNVFRALQRLNAPYVLNHYTADNGSVHSSTGTYSQTFFGVPGLANGTYTVKRHDVRQTVNISEELNETYIWDTGVAAETGFSAANPLYAMGYTNIVFSDESSATLQTYVYEVWNYLGQPLGWFPTTPANVEFAYTVHGLPTEIGGPSEVITFQHHVTIEDGQSLTILPGTELNLYGDLIIEDGASLEVKEGVTINFMDEDIKIVSNGSLNITGTVSDRVTINGYSSGTNPGNEIIANRGATIRRADIYRVPVRLYRYYGSDKADIRNSKFVLNQGHGGTLVHIDGFVSHVQFDGNYLKNGGTGLRVRNTSSIDLAYNRFEHNWTGLSVLNTTVEEYYYNVIDDCRARGVELGFGSEAYFWDDEEYGRNRVNCLEDENEIFVASNSLLFMGDQDKGGFNAVFNDDPDELIANLNSSHTVMARYTYWGTSSAPPGSWFYGSVDYGNHLSNDPTSQSGSPLARTLLPGEERSPIELRRERVLNLISELNQDHYRKKNDHRLTDLYVYMRMDREDEMELREQILSTIGEWSDKRNRINSTYGDDEQVRRAMETALLLQIRLAFRDNDYQRAKELNDAYSAYIQTTENVTALLENEMSIRMYHRDYEGALQVLSQIHEQSKKEPYYDETGLRDLELYLTHRLGQTAKGIGPYKLVDESMRPGASPEETPESFALEANYPNPFNPVTVIPFSLPEQSHVRLEVYDILGRRVTVLADWTFETGRHETSWDASQVTSGLYIVRMSVTTEDGQQSRYNRTMSLVK